MARVKKSQNLDEAIKIDTSAKKIDADIVKEVLIMTNQFSSVTKENKRNSQKDSGFQYKLELFHTSRATIKNTPNLPPFPFSPT